MTGTLLPVFRWALVIGLGCATQTEAAESLVCDVRASGAVGDGVADDTAAFEQALATCGGGGTVQVPAGRYWLRPLALPSRVTLHLDEGATLVASDRFADYPIVSARTEGIVQPSHVAFLSATDCEDLRLEGGGTIDGNGSAWWNAHRAGTLAHPRPRLVEWNRCKRIQVEGLTFVDPPFWALHPVDSEDVELANLKIRAPLDSPNTDGIDVDSSKRVRIRGARIEVGDDAIALKSGKRSPGQRTFGATEDVTVEHCRLSSGESALAIGSEMSGGVRQARFEDITIDGAAHGIRIKTKRGRGGVVEDVVFSRIGMKNVEHALVVTAWYQEKANERAEPVGPGTPVIRNVTLEFVSAKQVRRAGKWRGLPEQPLEGLRFRSVHIEAARGLEFLDARDVSFTDASVGVEEGDALLFERVRELTIDKILLRAEERSDPLLVLRDVEDVRLATRALHGRSALAIEGRGSRGIRIDAPFLRKQDVRFDEGATPDAVSWEAWLDR